MANLLTINLAAARLAALALGLTGAPDDQVLDKAVSILIDFDPVDRAEVAARAVIMGADPTLIQSFLNLVGGEVINVTARAPRRGSLWWWLLGGLAAASAGGYVIYRARRRRDRLKA